MSKLNLKGTGVAIVTPFREDKSVDFKSLEKLIDYIIAGKAEYLVVLGTTGESVTLNKDEKKAITNYVLDVVNKRVPVLLGIGGNNTQEVINTIRNTETDRISGILSVSPYYNKPTQKGLYEHYKAIAQVTELPIVLYNVPGRTGSNISAETTVKLANDFKNIIATKEASGNFDQVMKIIRDKPEDFMVISGDDAIAFPMTAIGGSGVISVIANAYPAEFSEMIRLTLQRKPDEAASIHYAMLDIIGTIFEEGNPAGIKALLTQKGIVSNNLRLPLVPVSDKVYEKLKIQDQKIRELNK